MLSFVLVGTFALATQAILVAPPSGPYAVSMSTQSLTDESRLDPFAPLDNPHLRRVMISTFLPVDEAKTPCAGRERVPYMTPLVAEAYDELGVALGLANETFSSLELELCVPRAQSCRRRTSTSFPLVLFSPGWGNPRLLYGAMAREVASYGFAVVTIDHPYDPSFVEFPDGEVYRALDLNPDNTTQLEFLVQVRADDVSFVLSQLHQKPNASMDLDRTIMFGHSLGGATAAVAMLQDSRILGGINLDGMLFNPALEAGLDNPFLLVGRPGHADDDSTWNPFYSGLRGQRALLSVSGTTHGTFTDFPILIDSFNLALPEELKSLLEGELGTIEFGRVGKVIAGIVGAFADWVFDDNVGQLFPAGNATLPEVSVLAENI